MERKFDLVGEMNRILSASPQPPLASEIDRLRALLYGIIAVYDSVKDKPEARIPSPLSLTIEAARPTPPPAYKAPYDFSGIDEREPMTPWGSRIRPGQ